MYTLLLSTWCYLLRIVFDSGRFLSLYRKWRHPQNRKYITYRIAARGWPTHDRREYVENIWWNLDLVFDICERTDKKTNQQTDTHTRRSQYCAPVPRAKQQTRTTSLLALVTSRKCYRVVKMSNNTCRKMNTTCLHVNRRFH